MSIRILALCFTRIIVLKERDGNMPTYRSKIFPKCEGVQVSIRNLTLCFTRNNKAHGWGTIPKTWGWTWLAPPHPRPLNVRIPPPLAHYRTQNEWVSCSFTSRSSREEDEREEASDEVGQPVKTNTGRLRPVPSLNWANESKTEQT